MVVSGRVDPKPEKCSPNPTLQVCGLGWVEPELESGWIGSGCSGRVIGLGCGLFRLSGFLNTPSSKPFFFWKSANITQKDNPHKKYLLHLDLFLSG